MGRGALTIPSRGFAKDGRRGTASEHGSSCSPKRSSARWQGRFQLLRSNDVHPMLHPIARDSSLASPSVIWPSQTCRLSASSKWSLASAPTSDRSGASRSSARARGRAPTPGPRRARRCEGHAWASRRTPRPRRRRRNAPASTPLSPPTAAGANSVQETRCFEAPRRHMRSRAPCRRRLASPASSRTPTVTTSPQANAHLEAVVACADGPDQPGRARARPAPNIELSVVIGPSE